MDRKTDEQINYGLLTEVARRYYIDGETQDAIGRALDLSRMKINRMLKEAQREGLVEIRVQFYTTDSGEIADKIRQRFGIRNVLIVPEAQDAERQRMTVAAAVSNYLESNIREGSIVAVGMGRNVGAVSRVQTIRHFENVTFVAASGGALEAGHDGNADHICRALAVRMGGRAQTLYAPAYMPDAVTRNVILTNETVRRTLDTARSADLALIGIGDLGVDSHIAQMGWFSAREILEARKAGVVGDLMGYDFFDAKGRRNDTYGERVVGLTAADLGRIDNVIAIASEPQKIVAIRGALLTGVVDTLATTLPICLELIK